MSSQEYKVRQAMVNINCNEPLFFHYNVLVNKFSGGCYDIYNPYAKLCVPDVVRDMNIKWFDLMSRTNETRYVSWNETCACKYRLDVSVWNDKQRWNSDKCMCECNKFNLLIRINVIIRSFGIPECVNLNVIIHAMLESTQIVGVEIL